MKKKAILPLTTHHQARTKRHLEDIIAALRQIKKADNLSVRTLFRVMDSLIGTRWPLILTAHYIAAKEVHIKLNHIII